jgi:SAM-dependent methyltransferase
VDFVESELDGAAVRDTVRSLAPHGADVVFASRVLHHAPKPAAAVRALAELLRLPSSGAPGGAFVLLDYAPHEDLALKESQADLWLGFADEEIAAFAAQAGLSEGQSARIPPPFRGEGPDAHLDWRVFCARRRAPALTDTSQERGLK